MLDGMKENVSLKPYTTFKIGGLARYFFEAENSRQIIEAIEWAKSKGLRFFILAGGSDLLVSDRGFDGLAIKTKNEKRKTKNENLKSKIIYCEAGVRLSDLVAFSLKNSLSGLEWAAGIPQATVGGAVWGNAGAFGKNVADVVSEVEAIEIKNEKLKTKNENLKLKILKNKDCEFGYKDSVFKGDKNLVILSADLVLEKKNKEEVKNEVKKILQYRKDHHPIEPSAGSVFKNEKLKIKNEKIFSILPESRIFETKGEIPAGFLVERCGLKGKKIGGAQISPKHANFIVNTGSAQAEDVVGLIKLARQKVREKFGIILEEEIQYVGF